MFQISFRNYSQREQLCGLPGNVAYYDISSRVHAIPGSYKMTYDIGGLMMSSEFLSQMRKLDIVKQAAGY